MIETYCTYPDLVSSPPNFVTKLFKFKSLICCCLIFNYLTAPRGLMLRVRPGFFLLSVFLRNCFLCQDRWSGDMTPMLGIHMLITYVCENRDHINIGHAHSGYSLPKRVLIHRHRVKSVIRPPLYPQATTAGLQPGLFGLELNCVLLKIK